MASNTRTARLIRLYEQKNTPPQMFLSGLFESPEMNYHNSEEVEYDIVRTREDISVPIKDISNGYRMNSNDVYTTTSVKPPIYKEAITINSFDLLQRMPGQTTHQDPMFQSSLFERMMSGMVLIEDKIKRAMELQASQVLQTGEINLNNASGTEVYEVDFFPKATHFPTAGTSWATAAGSRKMQDISDLAEIIRNDGLHDPDQLIMGIDAFENFINDSVIQNRFDNRRFDLGTISPMEMRGNGGSFRGIVEIGNYRYDVWTYSGRYTNPNGGGSVRYIDDGNIIVRASSGRLDATFGSIPNIGEMMGLGNRPLSTMSPGRMSFAGRGMDMFTNVWFSDDSEQMFAGVGSRPLMVPTAIDTYGCLNTQL